MGSLGGRSTVGRGVMLQYCYNIVITVPQSFKKF